MGALMARSNSKNADPSAQSYLTWKDLIKYELKNEMNRQGWEMLPGQTSLEVLIHIVEPSPHTRDLDNQIKAVLDAMNKIVYPDDRWVDVVIARRMQNKCYSLTIRVEILGGENER